MKNTVTPEDLLQFARPIDDGQDQKAVAAASIEAATGLVDAYCRGRHLDGYGDYRPGIRSVILTASARILANPGQVATNVQAGGVMVRRGVGFQGFTLAEQTVLNRYRRRAVG